jgi:FHA domain
VADRGFITPPPGLIPEPPAPPKAVPERPAVPVFFPAPPGAPPQPATGTDPAAAIPGAPSARGQDVPAPDPAPAAVRGWVLATPAGDALPLPPVLFLGRAPRAEDGAATHALPADGTVSKTHAVLRVEGDGVTLEDLHSTNGSAVADRPGGVPLLLTPGRPVPVPDGGEVRLGDAILTIRRV